MFNPDDPVRARLVRDMSAIEAAAGASAELARRTALALIGELDRAIRQADAWVASIEVSEDEMLACIATLREAIAEPKAA